MPNNKINIVYSLAFKCPFDLICTNCPIIKIRQIDVGKRFDYIDKLKPVEINELLENHFENYYKNIDINKAFEIKYI